jgi:hypothetical protein
MAAPIKRSTGAHMVMRFSFTGMHAAGKMTDKVNALGVPAKLSYEPSNTWIVITDTRALAHAPELVKFLGGAK